jgi:undecaprenyl phosphate N,N'-diacetylbacillosamine 1-phosphate transferase
MYASVIKHLGDKIVAVIALVLLSPIWLFVLLILIITNAGEPFFMQKRPGKDEKVFRLIKFKTMNNKRGVQGELLPDDYRLTRIGRFIRKTSIDELPQLINVLRGEMSLIGPRPLLIEYLPLYNENQRRRHEVRPGITGWAQVNGRNTIGWQKKFEYDVWYVDNLSIWLDLKILGLTIIKVFRGQGINQYGFSTTQKFVGNEQS